MEQLVRESVVQTADIANDTRVGVDENLTALCRYGFGYAQIIVYGDFLVGKANLTEHAEIGGQVLFIIDGGASPSLPLCFQAERA
jgi:hypothetical protein